MMTSDDTQLLGKNTQVENPQNEQTAPVAEETSEKQSATWKKVAIGGTSGILLGAGALYAVNFALKYPDCCGLLYLDAPVLDICSWPGGLGAGLGEESCWKECKEIYHLNDETALTFTGNPLDRTKELAKTGIPVMLVCGDADRYVPYAENGEPFYEKMKEAGADIMLIVKPGCDHHPHSLSDPAPVVDFIEKHYGIK